MANSNSFNMNIKANNKNDVLRALEEQINTGLTACGMLARTYAKTNIRRNETVDTSYLVNNVDFQVRSGNHSHIMEVGTVAEYAPYIEFGTGIYSTLGGRRSPWWWKGESVKWAGWHLTRGQKPKPFLKPALADHKEAYIKALKQYLTK